VVRTALSVTVQFLNPFAHVWYQYAWALGVTTVSLKLCFLSACHACLMDIFNPKHQNLSLLCVLEGVDTTHGLLT